MIDKEKIILMTKIECHKKRYLAKDQKIIDYFIEDYIYVKNIKMRIIIIISILMLAGVRAYDNLISKPVLPLSIKDIIMTYIMPYIVPWLLIMIIYSLVSGIVNANKYMKADTRMKKYYSYLEELEELENKDKTQTSL